MSNTGNIIYIIYISIIFIVGINSCVPDFDNKSSLTDEKIEKYLNVYTKIREKASEILEKLNENSESGSEALADFDDIIKEGGLDGYADFVRLNAKIGSVFSIVQANKGMKTFEKLNTDSKNMLDENIKQLKKALKDPDITEETKEEIRKSIEELEKGKSKLTEHWQDNEPHAKLVMEKVYKLAKHIASEQDIDVVIKNEEKIMKAYIGF